MVFYIIPVFMKLIGTTNRLLPIIELQTAIAVLNGLFDISFLIL